MNCPEPCRIGPAAGLPWATRSCSAIFADCGLHGLEVLLQLVAVVAHLAQRRGLAGPRLRVARRACRRARSCTAAISSRRACTTAVILLLAGLELRRGAPRCSTASSRASRTSTTILAVLVGDPADELGALEEVGEVARPEDDGEDVGLVGLEDLDEARREHRARLAQPALQPDEPRALGAQVGPRTLSSSARLASRSRWRTSWRPASVVIRPCRRLIRRVYAAMSLDSVLSAPFLRPIRSRVRSIFPSRARRACSGTGLPRSTRGAGPPRARRGPRRTR